MAARPVLTRGVVSETVCDLINDKNIEEWQPKLHFGKNQFLVPPPVFLDNSIPTKPGLELIVDIPVNPHGITGIYIDDFILLAVDIEGTDNLQRCNCAPLLAFNSCLQPLNENETIPCETMEARNKLHSEALLEEQKTILGWFINFQRLRIQLPDNKFKAWTASIKKMIKEESSTVKEIEQNIGQSVHLGLAIPSIHHFMSRLRDLHTLAKRRQSVKIQGEHIKDLQMMIEFLQNANEGISLNTIAFRQLTHIYRSDLCPTGLGGYSHKEWAWRYYLPEELKFCASNNLLEHLAAVISPWVDILANQVNPNNCVLLMTNSMMAKGWLKKSNFSKLGESPKQASAKIEAARMHASLFLKKGIKMHSQWFKGEENNVADALSCNNDRFNNKLTLIITSFCPLQAPSCFKILQLPKETISFLTALLCKLPVIEQLREEHTRSKLVMEKMEGMCQFHWH